MSKGKRVEPSTVGDDVLEFAVDADLFELGDERGLVRRPHVPCMRLGVRKAIDETTTSWSSRLAVGLLGSPRAGALPHRFHY